MIRPATRQDLDALVALEEVFPGDRMTRAAFLHLLTRAHADVLVAEVDGRVLGNAVVHYREGGRSARLYTIAVGPEARGRGLGRALLAAAEEAARARGRLRMRLEVREDNGAAIALYRSCGYRVRGRVPGYYEDGTAGLQMEKSLGPAVSR